MNKVKIERAYRIIKAVEDFVKTMKDVKIPLLQEALLSWSKKVFLNSGIVLALLVSLLIAFEIQFDLSNSFELFRDALGGIIFLFLVLHFKIQNFFARTTAKKWESKDAQVAKAILHKTK
jgi:hypothetical protein